MEDEAALAGDVAVVVGVWAVAAGDGLAMGELGAAAVRPNMTLMLSGRSFRLPPLLGKLQRWRHWGSSAKAPKPVLVAWMLVAPKRPGLTAPSAASALPMVKDPGSALLKVWKKATELHWLLDWACRRP
jgi:hypothetical protein